MPFRRFLAWLMEKVLELHLAVAVVLLVKLFLPLSNDSYSGFDAFASGVRDTWAGAAQDATYVTATFLNGSWLTYVGNTYLAAVFVVVMHGYIASLYIFLSLLARLLSHKTYVRYALIAYGLGAVIFIARYVRAWDGDMLRMATVMLVLGTGVVWLSAHLGQAWTGEGRADSGTRRVSLDLGA